MSSKKFRGFTLIEMVIALMILSGAVVIVSKMKFGNRQRTGKAHYYHKAVQLLEQKITELELEWSGQNFQSIPEEQNGSFENEKDFSWSVRTQPLQLPPSENMIKQFGNNTNEMVFYVAQTITTFLSQSVREARLTIYYKKDKSKHSYSLTTYIVDYTNEIQFSMGK